MFNTFMSTGESNLSLFVPAQFLPAPEINSGDDPLEMLRSLLLHDIPGFIIRREVEATPPVTPFVLHRQNVEKIEKALHELHPKKRIYPYDNNLFSGLGSNAIGFFHNDMRIGEVDPITIDTEPVVHTTLLGAGTVFMAAVGSAPEKVFADPDYSANSWKEPERLPPEHPHYLLLRGLVNPELTDPNIFTSRLNTGDTVVAADKGRYSIWHRFDTDRSISTERKVFVTNMLDRTTPPRFRKKRFRLGFDL